MLNVAALQSDTFLNTEDAARYLRLAPTTLNRLRVTGFGPPFLRLTPKCIRYRASDLRQWAEDQKHTSTAQYAK